MSTMDEIPPLPDAQFGMTLRKYNIVDLPADLPQRDAMIAANKFNHVRYRMLTVKQRLFVDAYLSNGGDATIAATQAGYPIADTLKVGKKLLKNKSVEQAILLAYEYHAKKNEIKVSELISEFKKIAFANPREFLSKDHLGRPEIIMPDKENPIFDAVKEINVTITHTKDGDENRNTSVKMYDKLSALNALLKYAAPEAARAAAASTTIVNNNSAIATASVSVINLLPVPQGQFLPAPPPPEALVIEHSPLIEMKTIEAKPIENQPAPAQGVKFSDSRVVAFVRPPESR